MAENFPMPLHSDMTCVVIVFQIRVAALNRWTFPIANFASRSKFNRTAPSGIGINDRYMPQFFRKRLARSEDICIKGIAAWLSCNDAELKTAAKGTPPSAMDRCSLYPHQWDVLPLLSRLPPQSHPRGRSSRFSESVRFGCNSSRRVLTSAISYNPQKFLHFRG